MWEPNDDIVGRTPKTTTAEGGRMGEVSERDWSAFHRVFSVTSGVARCSVGPELALKYGMEADNR